MAKSNTLQSRYAGEDGKRQGVLDAARECAALTKPSLLPPKGQTEGDRLPENYQSTGSRGLTNMEGRMLLALFPPGIPWFQFKLASEIRFDPQVPDESKQQIASHLLLRELQIVAKLEATNMSDGPYRRRSGFRSRKRMAISQVLATGDVLEQLTDDYRLRIYGREQYVTRRDSSGDVLFHIVREKIDVAKLSDEQRAASGLPPKTFTLEDPAQRIKDLYTLVEWNYDSRAWLIRQEVNARIIQESEEKISPYFCTPFELSPDEHYGRGFIELNLGDLRSHNELRAKKLDFAALASRMMPILDEGSVLRERDLAKPSGSVLRGRVRGGVAEDVAFLSVNKINDFEVVHLTDEAIRKDLGVAMLLESEVQPRGERVTAFQVQRVAMELEGALGGVYSSIADEQQVPLLRRLVHQMERDNLLTPLPEKAIEVETTTGIAALSREMDAGRLSTLIQGVAALGPEAMAKINVGVLVDLIARYAAFHEPGLIKSNEQLAQEQRQAMQQQLAMAAAGKAIDTAGNVVEANAQPQAQG